MRFQTPLVTATLIRRYKRFLADIRLEDGRVETAHCPNPGAMLGLQEEGTPIWVEPNDDPKKKLKYGWRLSELDGGHFAGIDTSVPNRVVKEALLNGKIPELSMYDAIRPEVNYGENSRIDFLLSSEHLPSAYIEVKNVHLRRDDDWAEFPDCVTARGRKHLEELSRIADTGNRAVMLYLVQRTDCSRFRLAADLDPAYAEAFDKARDRGIEILCYGTNITPEYVELDTPLSVDPDPQALHQG